MDTHIGGGLGHRHENWKPDTFSMLFSIPPRHAPRHDYSEAVIDLLET